MRILAVAAALGTIGCSAILGIEDGTPRGDADAGIDGGVTGFEFAPLPQSWNVPLDSVNPLRVVVVRAAGFDDDITITAEGDVAVAPQTLTAGATEAVLEFGVTGETIGDALSIEIVGISGDIEVRESLDGFVIGRPGTLDDSFAGDGIQEGITGPMAGARLNDVGFAADGGILVVGGAPVIAQGMDNKFCFARIPDDGSMVGALTYQLDNNNELAEATGVAVTASGQIALVGSHDMGVGTVRVNDLGDLDPGWSGDGIGLIARAGSIFSPDVATDGDAWVVSDNTNSVLTLTRFQASGVIDLNWGGGLGSVTVPGTTSIGRTRIARDSQGRFVAIGGNMNDVFIARVLADGTLDDSFDSDGVIQLNGSMFSAQDLAIAPDDSIIALIRGDQRAELRKYAPDGTPDPTFGTVGVAAITAGPARQARTMVLTRSGRIAIAGSNASAQPFVARFTSTGDPDPNFGTAGVAMLPGSLELVGMGEQPDERLIVVGFAISGVVLRMWN